MRRQVLAFLIAFGLIGAVALPAYAGVRGDGAALADAEPAAGVSVAEDAQGLRIAAAEPAPLLAERDSYTGLPSEPTAEQMAAAYRLAKGEISWPAADDYPYKDSSGYMSSLMYGIRQCTDFVAWRLNRDAGSFGEPWLMNWSYLTPNGGDASNWGEAWAAHGWATSTTPVEGSVAWFGAGANHVAYVQDVNDDGTIVIEEYNWTPLTYGIRTIQASSIPLFLYPPPTP